MHFSKFLLGECMSNYFFSLSSFICYNFEFYLFDTIWYWMLILYIYIKCCFIFLWRTLYFSSWFLARFWDLSYRSILFLFLESPAIGTKVNTVGAWSIWRRSSDLAPVTKCMLQSLALLICFSDLGQFSLFIVVIQFLRLFIVCWFFMVEIL